MSGKSTGSTVGAAGGAAVGSLWGPVGTIAGGAAGGLLGGFVGGFFDDDEAPPALPPPIEVDSSLYDPAAFDSISADAKKKANSANMREGPVANWSQADADRQLALDARGRQMGVADDLDAFLRGERPSQAEQQARRAQIGVANEIQQQAANARGGVGAQIAAQRQAVQAGVSNQLEGNARFNEMRAQEEFAARNQLAGLLTNARGQDLSMRGQSQDQAQRDVANAQTNTQMNDAQRRFYESLALQGAQGSAQVNQAHGAANQGAAGQAYGAAASMAQQQQQQGWQQQQNDQARNDAMLGKAMEAGATYASQEAMSRNNGPPTDEEWDHAMEVYGGKPQGTP